MTDKSKENEIKRLLMSELQKARPDKRQEIVEAYAEKNHEVRDEIFGLFELLKQLESTSLPETTTDEKSLIEVPDQFDGFKVVREVGRGGMGVIYEAEQEKLGRRVAIKICRHEFAAEKFLNEQRCLAQFYLSNIVSIFEAGETDSFKYMVMPFIEGATLDKVVVSARQLVSGNDNNSSIKSIAQLVDSTNEKQNSQGQSNQFENKPLNHSEFVFQNEYYRSVAECLIGVANAVERAHEQGFVHRDIKPDNVMVSRSGTPHLIDFGLASQLGIELEQNRVPQKDEEPVVHETDFLIGAPAYRAPEQNELRFSKATDVWGIGTILYELLTLRRAYTTKDRAEKPPHPSKHCRNVPKDLAAITMKCLCLKEPERYSSAQAVASDLQAWLYDQMVVARPMMWWGKFCKWCKRHPGVAAMSLMLMLSLAVGWIITSFYAKEANENATIANERATMINQSLVRHLIAMGKTKFEAGQTLEAQLWFANAFKQDIENQIPEETFRLRLAESINSNPKLEDLKFHDSGISSVAVHSSQDQSLVAVITKDRHLQIHQFGKSKAKSGRYTLPTPAGTVAISPSGQTLATGHHNGAVIIWDAKGERTATLSHARQVASIEFSPDGQSVLVGTGKPNVPQFNSEAVLWDISSAKQLKKIHSCVGWINKVGFSTNGNKLFAVGGDTRGGFATVYDLVANKKTVGKTKLVDIVRDATFSPDGTIIGLAIGGARIRTNRGLAIILDANTGEELATPIEHESWVQGICFNPDGSQFVTATWDGKIRVWNAHSYRIEHIFQHDREVLRLRFSPNGRYLASSSVDQSARVWDCALGSALTGSIQTDEIVIDAAFVNYSKQLVVASRDGTVRLLNLTTMRTPSRVLRTTKNDARIESFSRDGNWVGIKSGKTALIWDWQTGKKLSLAHPKDVTQLSFSANSKLVLTNCDDGTARVWDLDTRKLRSKIKPEKKMIWTAFRDDSESIVAVGRKTIEQFDLGGKIVGESIKVEKRIERAFFSADGSHVATVSGKYDQPKLISCWNIKGAQKTLIPYGNKCRQINHIQFTQDNRCLAIGSDKALGRQGSATVWNIESGKQICDGLETAGMVMHVGFAPNEKRIAASTNHGRTHILDIDTGQTPYPFLETKNTQNYRSVWHPNRKWILTSSNQGYTTTQPGSVQLWDAQSGDPISSAIQVNAWISSVVFTPDGEYLITCSWDQSIRCWKLESNDQSISEIVNAAELYSRHKIDDELRFVPLSNDEIKDRWAKYQQSSNSSQSSQSWHDQVGAESQFLRRHFSAAYHLQAAVKTNPTPSNFYKLANALAALERWNDASLAYRKLEESVYKELASFESSLLLLQLEKTNEFDQRIALIANTLLEEKSKQLDRDAWLVCLRKQPNVNYSKLWQLYLDGSKKGLNDQGLKTAALLAIRSNRPKDAMKIVQNRITRKRGRSGIFDLLLLAMISNQNQKPDESVRYIKQAKEKMKQRIKLDTWQNKVEHRILLRELGQDSDVWPKPTTKEAK